MNVFVISDNIKMYEEIKRILSFKDGLEVSYYCSAQSRNIFERPIANGELEVIDIITQYPKLIGKYQLGISCHSKQIFPDKLIEQIRCINIHPGFNPYNRGWYPHVFSIINGLPAGATIHEMDRYVDHGPIVAQEEVPISSNDTSLTLYCKVQEMEIRLLDENIDAILNHSYSISMPANEGNYNSISDFKRICEIDLDQKVTMQNAINWLRALSHPPYKNAFFYDRGGKRIFLVLSFFDED